MNYSTYWSWFSHRHKTFCILNCLCSDLHEGRFHRSNPIQERWKPGKKKKVKATTRSYSSIFEKTNTACQCHLSTQYHTWTPQKPWIANWFVSLTACLHIALQLGRVAHPKRLIWVQKYHSCLTMKLHLYQLSQSRFKINLRNMRWWCYTLLLLLKTFYSMVAWVFLYHTLLLHANTR